MCADSGHWSIKNGYQMEELAKRENNNKNKIKIK